jgi:hypothetical protein
MNKVKPSSSTYKAPLIYKNIWLLYIYLTWPYKTLRLQLKTTQVQGPN